MLVKPGPVIKIVQVWQEIEGVSFRVKFVRAASWVCAGVRDARRVLGDSELSWTPVSVAIDMPDSS